MTSERTPTTIDMSPEAIGRRLREVADLRELTRKLARFRDLGPAEAAAEQAGEPDGHEDEDGPPGGDS